VTLQGENILSNEQKHDRIKSFTCRALEDETSRDSSRVYARQGLANLNAEHTQADEK